MTKMFETYFIRHKFAVWKDPGTYKIQDIQTTLNVLKEAWEKRLAVIDYEEIINADDAFRPEAYSTDAAKKTILKINKMLNGEGLIAIFSVKSHPGKLLVGKVKADSAKLYEFEAYPGYFFKVIELEKVSEVSVREYSGLFSKIPRQTTFTRWPLANRTLNQIFQGEHPKVDVVENLDDSQLEIICYEWLKSQGKLKYLTLPIGRTMIYVDIVGVDEKFTKVFAQVTFSNDENIDKISALNNFKHEDNRYYFCKGVTKVRDGIQFVSIDEVFSYFKSTFDGVQYLESLVGLK